MKRRKVKKELEFEEKYVLTKLQDCIPSLLKNKGGVSDEEHRKWVGSALTYLLSTHLKLDPSWPHPQRWLDFIDLNSLAAVEPANVSAIGTLWWGLSNNAASAQVPEPFEARLRLPSSLGGSSLMYLIKFGAGQEHRRILVPKGIVPQFLSESDSYARDGFGNPSLVNASGNGDCNTVQNLLDSGVDVNAVAASGCTALIAATMFDHPKVVKLLLARGANTESQVGGDTPLILAATYGHAEGIDILLSYGAEVNVRNYSDETALMNAEYGLLSLATKTSRPYGKIVEMLKNAGAKK